MTSYNPYYDDVKSRNSMKSGAFHKKNGSKSKKCSLPSDNLTDAQKRKLDGPVRVYNVKAPMSWENFKALPHDMQQMHVDFLQETFAVSGVDIGTTYFGLAKASFKNYATWTGLYLTTRRGSKLHPDEAAKFAAWLGGRANDEVDPEPAIAAAETPVAPIPAPAYAATTRTSPAQPTTCCCTSAQCSAAAPRTYISASNLRRKMKHEKRVFEPHSNHRLLYEASGAIVARDDVDLLETIGIGLTANLVNIHLTKELFGDSEEAITLRGEDFTAKEMVIFRAIWSHVDDVAEMHKGDETSSNVIGNTFRMMGTAAALLLGVEDKLFGSDHVEEHEAVKKEETNE